MDTLALSLAVETTGTGTQRPRASVPLGLFSRDGRDVSYFGWKGQVGSFARFVLLTNYCYCCYDFLRLIPMKLLLERLAVWTFFHDVFIDHRFGVVLTVSPGGKSHRLIWQIFPRIGTSVFCDPRWSIWYWSDSTHEFFLDCPWNIIIWAFLAWLQEFVLFLPDFSRSMFRCSKKSETSIHISPIYNSLPETNSLPDQVRGGKIMVQCTDPSPLGPTPDPGSLPFLHPQLN